jgi:hypothetical protein
VEPEETKITYQSARGYGDVFALHELWKDLGFDRALRRALRSGRRGFDAEALIRAMVFNRLCCKFLFRPRQPLFWTHLCCVETFLDDCDNLSHDTRANTEGALDHAFLADGVAG